MHEEFTIAADDGQTWTRSSIGAAKSVADNLASRGRPAKVYITETLQFNNIQPYYIGKDHGEY